MSNIYQDHLEQLRRTKLSTLPAISLYIPLKWNDFSPARIFSALVKAADGLMRKSGHPKLELTPPDWDRWMRQGTVTLAVFHHQGVTTLIPLPTRMQPRVVVARSFHIKPIVAAAQECVDALLLHYNESGASLYRINAVGETFVDSYLPDEIVPKSDWPVRLDRFALREFLEFLHREVRGSILPSTKLLGVTGSAYSELQSVDFWKSVKIPVTFLDDSFRSAMPQSAFSILRLRLSQHVNETHALSVQRVALNPQSSPDLLSIRTLAPKLLTGEVKRLCVSLDTMYFGEIDPSTGIVTVHKAQLNAADDDVLDDLVELAIDRGVEVSVVPQKFLPKGRSFLAS